MRNQLLMRTLLLLMLAYQSVANEYVLNAALVGRKGEVKQDEYQLIADALSEREAKQTGKQSYCRIDFTTLEYDTTNGSSVYNSLKEARATFENKSMAVAIGPQIDVFSSTDYVILHQVLFVTSSDESVEQANRTMPILPDPKSLSSAIGQTAKMLKWHKVAFLSQDDFSPVLALGSEEIFVSPIRLPTNIQSADDPQLQQTLTTLRESQMDKFILHSMKKDVVKTVISAAQRLHLLHHTISWLITYLDFADITGDLHEMATLYGFQLLQEKTQDGQDTIPAVILERYNKSVSRLDLGMMVDVIGVLMHYHDKHVPGGCTVEPKTNQTMTSDDFQRTLKIAVKSYRGVLGKYLWPQLNQGETSSNRDEYAIPIHQYIDKIVKVGDVISSQRVIEVDSFRDLPKPAIDKVFKDKTFRIVAKQDEPFVMRRPDGGFYGFCVDVLRELSNKLNGFDYEIYELDQDVKKTASKAMQWDEIITQLKVGNASIAIGAFAVTADREEKVSFSYTIMSSSVSMLLKRPPETSNFFQFLWPFSKFLWLMIVLFFLVVGVCLYVMYRFDTTQSAAEQKFDLKESMWYSLNVLLQGTTEYSPQTTSSRTIIAFFWFCVLVINAAYTANLAAFLTLQQIDNRVKSVEYLARQTAVKYGVLNNSDLMHFFRKSRGDPYERMWAFMKLNEKIAILPNRSLAIQKVLHSEYVYLDDGVINNYIAGENCEAEAIEQNFGFKHFSFGFPKGAPYRDDINRALLKLKEDGTLDKLRDKWWSPSENCSVNLDRTSTKVKTASELGLMNMLGVFIVLIACTVLAILYEIGHKVTTVYNKKKQKKVKEEEENDGQERNNTKTVQFGFAPQGIPEAQAN